MKMPRTMNDQYALIRAKDAEQREEALRRKSAKREAVSTPSVCRRIVLASDVALPTIAIPVGQPTPLSLGEHATLPSMTPQTPHAYDFQSQPDSDW